MTTTDSLSNYTFIRSLGKGSYGQVGLYKRNLDNIDVAIKIQPIKNVYHNLGEIDVASRFRHPNLANFISFFFERDNAYFVYEVGKDWYAEVSTLTDRLHPMFEIASAVNCLHTNAYYHCDIKPQNILVFDNPDGTKRAVLTDFGMAKSINVPPYPCGTLDYDAPEFLTTYFPVANTIFPPNLRPYLQQPQYGQKSDIWALGITFIEMITGSSPFSTAGGTDAVIQNMAQYLENPTDYLEGKIMGTPLYGNGVQKVWIPFLLSMVNPDINSRITVNQLLNNPPFSAYASIPCNVYTVRVLHPSLVETIDFKNLRRIVFQYAKQIRLTYYQTMTALDLFYRVYDGLPKKYSDTLIYGVCLLIATYITDHFPDIQPILNEIQKSEPSLTSDVLTSLFNSILTILDGKIMFPTLYDYSYNKGTLLKSFYSMLKPEYITTNLQTYAINQLYPHMTPANTISLDEKYKLITTRVYMDI